MVAAPITIGGEKYVCVVEVIANRQVTRLYVHEVTLTKNLQGDVADSNAVPEDNSLVTQPQGEIAKVLRNYVNTKNNGENNTKTENRHMNKKQIRLTESDLKQIVKESVKIILNEAYYDHNFADLLAQHGGYDKKKKNNTMYGSGSITTDISYDDVDIVVPNEDFAMGYIWAKYYKDKSDNGVDVNTSSGLYNLHDFLYDMSVHLSDGSILIFKQDAYDKLNNPQGAEKKRKQREFDRYHYNDGYQPVMNAKNHTSYNNDDFYFTKNGDYADKMRDTIYK